MSDRPDSVCATAYFQGVALLFTVSARQHASGKDRGIHDSAVMRVTTIAKSEPMSCKVRFASAVTIAIPAKLPAPLPTVPLVVCQRQVTQELRTTA